VATVRIAHASSGCTSRPILFLISDCTGLASCATAAATRNRFAMLALFASVAPWDTATYQPVFSWEA
jgi:hypothetical protein